MITVEYLPSSLNKVADLESRRKVDSSEWVLCRHVFRNFCLKLGTLTVDLFASRVSHQVAWKPDPYSIATDAMSILWTRFHCYAFPPCTKQNTTIPSIHSNIDNTLLANTVVVSASVGNADKETSSDTKFNHTLSRSKRESSSISVEQNSYISGMAGFREELSLQGVSEETTQLIAKSRRLSALGNYESTWKKWSGWCDSWKIDPFRCPVNYVLEHLSSLFYHEKLLYRTIGLHRSVIPA